MNAKDRPSPTNPNSAPPVAIIGMACMFPKAGDLATYWSNLKGGVDAIEEVPQTHWRIADYFDEDPHRPDMTYARRGGFLDPIDFSPIDYGISPNDLEATDTAQLLALVAAERALRDAGYAPDRDIDRNRVSVILGVTGALELVIPLGARLGRPRWRRALLEAGVDAKTAAEVEEKIAASYVGWQESSFPGLLGNVVAGRIANRLDLGGTNCVVDAACASSLSALHLATLELASGRSDMVVTGGIDTFNDIFMYMCFSKTPALSPTGDAKPFDCAADGTILGEGVGILVLKRLEDAEQARDRVYGIIRSVGSSSDGKGNAIYAPSARGQAKALREAYQLADVSPRTIELVEAHGTGTRVGDTTELSALREVYGSPDDGGDASPRWPWCALGSVKSQIGHTKAAAGVAGLIKCILALHHKVLPPTIKISEPLELAADSPFSISSTARPWLPQKAHPRRAAVSSFGFGGSNFHCVVEEYEGAKTAADWTGCAEILAYSGRGAGDLSHRLESIAPDLSRDRLREEGARSRAEFVTTDRTRLVLVVARGHSEFAKVRNTALRLLREERSPGRWATPDGVYFGRGEPGKLVALFPGQGSQSVDMLRDLACQFPEMLAVLTASNAALTNDTEGEPRLSDRIYPPSAFSDPNRQRQDEALRATDIAQPAIGAVSLGALRILERFALPIDAVGGHSYGELVALCAAGRIDERSLHLLSYLRGRLMAGGERDKGGMLAVECSLTGLEDVLATESLDLVIANRNAPRQAVLSGTSAEINRAGEVFTARGIRHTRLPVAAAFHSPLVADAREPFARLLEKIRFAASRVPVYANTTGREYPAAEASARELLAHQLAKPVRFVEEIENLYRWGARTFVEVGPGARLTSLVGAILGERDHLAVAVDASGGKRSGIVDLARLLAQLAAVGHPVALPRWEDGPAVDRGEKPAFTIPIGGANYRKPHPETIASAAVDAPPRPDRGARSDGLTPAKEAVRPATAIRSTSRPLAPPRSPAHRSAAHEAKPFDGARPAPAPTQALQVTQENLIALQRMQEQTARLHKQFLEGQEIAQKTFHALLERQQKLLRSSGREETPEPRGLIVDDHPRARDLDPTEEPGPRVTTRDRRTDAPPDEPQGSPGGVESATIRRILLETVAEKTGYPPEMLEHGMGLEADLGIDSIKRVEILSALKERLPEIPAVEPEHLGSLNTLEDIVSFLTFRPPADAATAAVDDSLRDVLLATVAEKTGYPPEMLTLEMDLEADLGIDSIKRVEILSALQERLPTAPEVPPDELGTLNTLDEIVDFLASPRPVSPPTAVGIDDDPPDFDAERLTEVLMGAVSEKTGYPVEMLELDMELEVDLGIDSIKRVEILSVLQERLPHAPVVRPDELGEMHTLRAIVAFLRDGIATPATPSPVPALPPAPAGDSQDGPLERSSIRVRPLASTRDREALPIAPGSEFWITQDGSALSGAIVEELRRRGYMGRIIALEKLPRQRRSAPLGGLLLLAPERGADDAFLRVALRLVQIAAPGLRAAGRNGGAVLVTVSRLDGAFGFSGITDRSDLASGGLAGLSKTAANEWPEVSAKAIDLDPDDSVAIADSAARVVDEMLHGGPVEVGLSQHGARTLTLTPLPFESGDYRPLQLQPGEVVVLSGGARGVTAATACALAPFGLKLVLLGRSSEPEDEPGWLASLDDEGVIKKALLDRAERRPSPKELAEIYRDLMSRREIRNTLARIRDLSADVRGANVRYLSVDVRDTAAVKKHLDQVRSTLGPIRGVIHGAGVLADQRIEDKTEDSFQRVYDTKVAGARALLAATANDPLAALVFFSSSSARFGRAGQVDYAIANEVLNKIAQREARVRPYCRVLAVNWGPWDGGMVTPALKALFHQEGVGLIPQEQGANHLVRELCDPPAAPVEVVVMAPVSVVAREEQGSAPTGATGEAERRPGRGATPPSSPDLHPTFERELSLREHPFLHSHVIDGRPVLPMAMIIEWLAHGALHGNPDLLFHGFDDLRVLKGVVLDDGRDHLVRILAGRTIKQDNLFYVPVELRGVHSGEESLHARARVVLTRELPREAPQINDVPTEPYARRYAEVYQDLLFHGPDFQGLRAVEACSHQGIVGSVRAAPPPSRWITRPLRGAWLSDPLVIDSSFQLMILWSFEKHGRGSLPCSTQRYRQFRREFPPEGVQVVIQVTQSNPQQAFADIEYLDGAGNLIARMDNYECVIHELGNLREASKH